MYQTGSAKLSAEPLEASPALQRYLPAWGLFWALMFLLALQDSVGQGVAQLWRPLLWEGSSCLVASVIVAWQWRRAETRDAWLAHPWRWFAMALTDLPVAAAGFVAAVYASRHAVHTLMGLSYYHAPWLQVVFYESIKFAMFFLLFAAAIFGIRSNAQLDATRVRVERERALANRAQLLQLAQQIEPHFLFNTLNTIAALVHDGPDTADTLLLRLAALLRAASELTRQPEVALDDELRLAEAYSEIMVQRFAGRACFRMDVDEAARLCRVPSLVLQPLLENAFRHGVEQTLAPVVIELQARHHGDRLELTLQDDAGRLTPGATENVGLSNLRQRLTTRYGGDASFALSERSGGGVVAQMVLPCVC